MGKGRDRAIRLVTVRRCGGCNLSPAIDRASTCYAAHLFSHPRIRCAGRNCTGLGGCLCIRWFRCHRQFFTGTDICLPSSKRPAPFCRVYAESRYKNERRFAQRLPALLIREGHTERLSSGDCARPICRAYDRLTSQKSC